MDFHDTVLPSGIRVVTETMASVRSTAIGFWIGVGSRDEEGSDQGASHFLEHLLFKGTEQRSAKQIAEEIDSVGGDLNAFTSKEYTCFYARVLDHDLPVAADVLADMVSSATISSTDVEQERHVVLEEINIHFDTPEDLVHSDFAQVLFDGHPLAREVLGTADSLASMSRPQVHDYYTRYYSPVNLTIAVAGNVSHGRVLELAESLVGDLGRPSGVRPQRTTPDNYAGGKVGIRSRPTEQAHVVLGTRGLRRDDERRFVLYVLNTVLGAGMSSRLFQGIREERGLAYSTYSYHSSYLDGGYLGAYAGTTPAKVDELLKVLCDELDRLPETIEGHEVERAKGNVKGGMVLGLEDTSSRMTRLGKMVATGAEVVGVDEALRRVDAVEFDAVRQLASDLIAAPRCLALVGPFDSEDRERFAAYVR
ncbi:MAG: M16 family metallopeptidase [Nitriliruptorales bacterium]